MLATKGEYVRSGDAPAEYTETTYGRLVFNRIFPADFEFMNQHMNKKVLSKLILKIVEFYGIVETHYYLDKIKSIGFEYSTLSGITWGMNDTQVPKEKNEIVATAEEEVLAIESQHEEGFLTDEERREKIIMVWTSAREKIAKFIPKTLSVGNPVYSIIDSGARGSWSQPIQMMGMKGLVINPKGEIIELPSATIDLFLPLNRNVRSLAIYQGASTKPISSFSLDESRLVCTANN